MDILIGSLEILSISIYLRGDFMISRVIPMLVLSMTFTSCYLSTKSVSVIEVNRVKVESKQRDLSLIHSTTTLRQGDVGIITIQGEPGEKFLLESTFNDGFRTIPVSQLRTGDSRGYATFSWVVSEDTAPGTYPITIRGSSGTLTLSHTVIP